VSEVQLNFVGLLLGFANTPFLFYDPRFYEIAIASAYCLMSAAIYYLYEIFNDTARIKNVFLFAVCLSLSVAGRPHFALALYNYLRFDSFLEFGHRYQVSTDDYTHAEMISADFYYRIPLQIYYYFMKPFVIHATHPLPHWLLPFLTGNIIYEFTTGVLTTAPFICLMLLVPRLYKLLSKKEDTTQLPLLWFLASVTFMAGLILAFLMSVAFVAERYETDFLPYFVICTIISFWLLQTHMRSTVLQILKSFFVFTGVSSILIGLCFGMMAYGLHGNLLVFSKLSIFLSYFMPVTLGVTIVTMRSMQTLPNKNI
jgi:hypothetical protein